jgi:hypothetical protein
MKLLDNKGKEWSFEFCFWHSKDSRIYYFKKFYPFVQSENLVGGDTGAVCSLSLCICTVFSLYITCL